MNPHTVLWSGFSIPRTLKMNVLLPCKISGTGCPTTECHITVNFNLQPDHCGNLKLCVYILIPVVPAADWLWSIYINYCILCKSLRFWSSCIWATYSMRVSIKNYLKCIFCTIFFTGWLQYQIWGLYFRTDSHQIYDRRYASQRISFWAWSAVIQVYGKAGR
jgi:hypothetical protein